MFMYVSTTKIHGTSDKIIAIAIVVGFVGKHKASGIIM